MKRFTQCALACALALAVASSAAAQAVPTPVIRMGDWVEVGNELFMNFIGGIDIRYRTTQNWDFESEVRDRVSTRNPVSSNVTSAEGDILQAEVRFGMDVRYQKSLTMRILAEAQSIFDGNLIDDRSNSSSPGASPPTDGIVGPSGEDNGFHVERFWINYAFPNTPLSMRIGADLWTTDQAHLLGDDDPRFAVFLDLGPKKEIQLYAAAVIQNEAARLGLQNDNDFIYYTFGVSFNARPHKVALDVAYFRDRFSGASEQGANAGQQFDAVLISPSYTGSFGPIRALAQFSVSLGTGDGNSATDCDAATPGFQRCEYDVFSWAVVAHVEAKLAGGLITPFVGVIYGTGDDDPGDDKLGGFNIISQNKITLLTSNGYMDYLTTSPSVDNNYGPASPARAPFAGSGATNGDIFRHTSGNPFSDTVANTAHRGIRTAYSNPGTLLIPVGVKIAPLKGHELVVWYMYTAFTDTSTLEAVAAAAGTPTSIDTFLWHDISAAYTWVLNPHFDIRLSGSVFIPGDGTKDIASTQICDNGLRCQGEDPALTGELRFRGRF